MKRLIAVLLAGLCYAAWGADGKVKPAPVMPTEVTLTTGRVLRNVKVIRWESNRVMLKHAGGVDPIPYTLFRVPTPAEIVTIKNSMVSSGVESQPSSTDNIFSGEVFIVTKDSGAKYIEGAVIYILPEEAWLRVQSNLQPKLLPKPFLEVKSDNKGRFEFTLPRDTRFMLLAQCTHIVDQSNTEQYEWRLRSLSMTPGENIQLTSDNDYGTVHQYRFP